MEIPQLPDELASARPFLQRAKDLKPLDPVVSYYCVLHAVELIIATKLHQSNDNIKTITGSLMTLLETEKQSPRLLDSKFAKILASDELSEAHCLAFADGFLEKATLQMSTLSVTKGTAALLMAASTVFELESTWHEATQPVREKTKFAKYKAALILRAFSKGEDPNENPEITGLPEDDVTEGDLAEEAELELLKQANPSAEEEPSAPQQSTAPEPQSSVPGPETELTPTPPPTPASAPAPVPAVSAPEDTGESIILPSAPHNLADPSLEESMSLPGVPEISPNDLGLPEIPSRKPSVPFAYDPPPSTPKAEDFPREDSPKAPAPKINTPTVRQPLASAQSSNAKAQSIQSIMSAEKAVGEIQKHGKYALSALNYDDYKTAISEFSLALAKLKDLTHNQ